MSRLNSLFCMFVGLGSLLLHAGTAYAQFFPEHILDALNARQVGNGIEVSWVMGRGVECIGIDVERSVNGGALERVFAIGGVCGSPDGPEPYRFSDEQLNTSGYYTYFLSFGSIGEARVSTTFQQVWASGLSLLPSAGGHLLRVEGLQGSFEARVHNLQGSVVFTSGSVFQNEVWLPTSSWPNGVYVVVVEGGGEVLTQKWGKL